MCIGSAMIRTSPVAHDLFFPDHFTFFRVIYFVCIALMVLYVLAAMIRLAYFNVTEEERQKTVGGKRKEYLGLPVTSAALIFPSVMMFQYFTTIDITLVYFPVILITGLLFLMPIRIPKPGLRGTLILIGIGFLEFLLMIFTKVFNK